MANEENWVICAGCGGWVNAAAAPIRVGADGKSYCEDCAALMNAGPRLGSPAQLPLRLRPQARSPKARTLAGVLLPVLGAALIALALTVFSGNAAAVPLAVLGAAIVLLRFLPGIRQGVWQRRLERKKREAERLVREELKKVIGNK